MAVTSDIVATYRGPRRVVRRILADGHREDRALVFLMAACVLLFVARWPGLARQAHLEEVDLNPLMGGALMGLLFIAPLVMYALAALSHLVARLVGGAGSWFGARIALFWALLAASPLFLLNGLVAGFIGPGTELKIVGALALAIFLWFWLAGLVEAESRPAPA